MDAPSHAHGFVLGRMRLLLRLLGPNRRLIALAAVSGIGHQLVALSSATVAAWLVGRAISGASASELERGLVVLALLVAPLVLLPWLESFVAHVAAFRVLADLRGRVFDAFERAASTMFLQRRSGDLGATAVSDVESLERFFAHTLSPLIVASTVPVAALAGLAILHPGFALALLPAWILLLSVPGWLRRSAASQGDAVRARMGELHAESVELVQGVRERVVFGCETAALDRLAAADTALLAAKLDHSRRAGLEHAATDVLMAFGVLCVLATGAALSVRELVPPWHLPVSVILAATSLLPVAAVLDVLRDLNLAAGAAERVDRILSTPALPDLVGTDPDRVTPIDSAVHFDAVEFRYAADLPSAVRDVTFEIRAGETVALVGHSGAGKSTVAGLLLRLWDVSAGAVRVGGHDVRAMSQHRLHELVTVVPQDVYLFNQTLRDNIRLGSPDADDRAVEAAARAAMAHGFISELPSGYDTRAGELGARLSGGQRQRIAIARALLQDTPILVLDEAVSNVDAASEHEINAAIARVRQGRTALVIAHRLSTIRTADRVVVLERGRVVEQGTHDELVARGGAYVRLLASQL